MRIFDRKKAHNTQKAANKRAASASPSVRGGSVGNVLPTLSFAATSVTREVRSGIEIRDLGRILAPDGSQIFVGKL